MLRVVFLDRDGVINKERADYVKTPDEFEILPTVEKWLKVLVDNDFKLIVITNQSMVGRGLSTKEQLDSIHEKMQDIFKKNGFQVEKIYCCLHTPEENCKCRKPNIMLFEDAVRDFNIDIPNSWLIGDKESDMLAGQRLGCNTVKVSTNTSLCAAVLKILNDP